MKVIALVEVFTQDYFHFSLALCTSIHSLLNYQTWYSQEMPCIKLIKLLRTMIAIYIYALPNLSGAHILTSDGTTVSFFHWWDKCIWNKFTLSSGTIEHWSRSTIFNDYYSLPDRPLVPMLYESYLCLNFQATNRKSFFIHCGLVKTDSFSWWS